MDGIERCIDDELPFEIPDSWAWERLGNIGETNIGLTYSPSDKTPENGVIVLRSSNIRNGKMVYDDVVMVSCDVPARAMINIGCNCIETALLHQIADGHIGVVNVSEQFAGGAKPTFPLRQTVWNRINAHCGGDLSGVVFAIRLCTCVIAAVCAALV